MNKKNKILTVKFRSNAKKKKKKSIQFNWQPTSQPMNHHHEISILICRIIFFVFKCNNKCQSSAWWILRSKWSEEKHKKCYCQSSIGNNNNDNDNSIENRIFKSKKKNKTKYNWLIQIMGFFSTMFTGDQFTYFTFKREKKILKKFFKILMMMIIYTKFIDHLSSSSSSSSSKSQQQQQQKKWQSKYVFKITNTGWIYKKKSKICMYRT